MVSGAASVTGHSNRNRNRNRGRDNVICIGIEQQAQVASRDDLPSAKRWDAVNAALGQLNALVGKQGTVVPKFLIMSEIAQTVRCFVYGYCPQYLHPVVDALAFWAVVLRVLASSPFSSNHKIPSKYEAATYVTLTIVSLYIMRGLIMKMAHWLQDHFFDHLASYVHEIWKRITESNNGATTTTSGGSPEHLSTISVFWILISTSLQTLFYVASLNCFLCALSLLRR